MIDRSCPACDGRLVVGDVALVLAATPGQRGDVVEADIGGAVGDFAGASGAVASTAVLHLRQELVRLLGSRCGPGELREHLLPEEGSGLEIMIRAGARGPFAFKANQARALVAKYNTPKPPTPDEETVVGKLQAIDFQRTIMTVKPGGEPALRMDYPLPLEGWLQANVRKRLKILGKPSINQRGDISSFSDIQSVVELEPHLNSIADFVADQLKMSTSRPLTLPVTVYWADRLFGFIDDRLGIDIVVDDLVDLRDAVLSELAFVWKQYAQADDQELDEQARQVKRNLLSRFGQQVNG